MSDSYKLLADHYYGRGPMMSSLAELQRDHERKMREAMCVNPIYLMPAFKAGDFILTPKLETKMPLVEPKPLSHPVQLLVNALSMATDSRNRYKHDAEIQDQGAKNSRGYEEKYDVKVVELTKALKKLGHKA